MITRDERMAMAEAARVRVRELAMAQARDARCVAWDAASEAQRYPDDRNLAEASAMAWALCELACAAEAAALGGKLTRKA